MLVGSKICYEKNLEIRPAGVLATDGPKALRRKPANVVAVPLERREPVGEAAAALQAQVFPLLYQMKTFPGVISLFWSHKTFLTT